MAVLDLVTRENLEKFRIGLLGDLKALLKPQLSTFDKQWLKSFGVRKLLNISPGTLHNLRINGTLPYSTVASACYYKLDDITKLLEKGP